VKSSLSISPWHDHELTPSTAYTEYSLHRVQHTPSAAYTESSIHRVQHTPSTASTQDWLFSLHSHDYKLTHECSFSFRRTSLHDRPPSSSSPSEHNGKVTLSHSHGCELTNWWIESHHPVRRPSTTSKYSSNLTRSWPPSASPILFDHGIQVYLQTRSITAFKCISKLARLRPTCSHEHALQVHLQSCSITASKCNSNLARSRPPSISPNSLDYGLQVCTSVASKCISNLAGSLPPSESPISLDHGLQVPLQTPSITASKCISEFTRSQPLSASLSSLNPGLQLHLQTRSITSSVSISEFTRSSSAGTPRIADIHCVLPVQIYRV